jgi:hypothetical protein
MDNDPEKAAEQNSEEIKEGKQPGKGELFAQLAPSGRGEADNKGDHQARGPNS